MSFASLHKTGLALAGAVALIASVGAAAAQQSTLQKVLSSGTLRVGTTGDYNPMTIFDPATKSYKGYEIDAATKLAADLGVKLEFVRTDWKTLIQGLTSDKYDILMSGTSLSIARFKVVSFTNPYNSYFMVGLALKDKAGKFKSWDDVNKKETTVAVTLGTNFEGIAKEVLAKSTLKRIEAPAREYQEVLAGRADIGLTSSTEAAGLIKTYPNLRIVLADAKFGKQVHGYMVRQGDFTWVNYLNSWLALREADGTLPAIRAKWLALE
ncbi:MAG: transporter substrate-binding domain-containing protein [Rhodospirillaceae bacterium]|nr:transporter substrate-binding domain-containing protein [Rhodospirillaceae bacterium]